MERKVMKVLTEKEFNKACDFWYKQKHLTAKEKANDHATRQFLGVYTPSTGELHGWRITPSSEDKGYSSN